MPGRHYQKRIVWSYGDVCGEEYQTDLSNEFAEPVKGDLITRNGKNWKVTGVDKYSFGSGELPQFRVYLQEEP
jgi:hypothetical protein